MLENTLAYFKIVVGEQHTQSLVTSVKDLDDQTQEDTQSREKPSLVGLHFADEAEHLILLVVVDWIGGYYNGKPTDAQSW